MSSVEPVEITDAEPRRGRITTEQIVDRAAALFAARGYHDVGMRDIAESLGVRGASLYHHYAAKEEILYAICLRVTREPAEHQLPLLDAAGTPRTRLTALVRAHMLHLSRRQLEHLVGRHELNALTPAHREVVDGHRRYYQRRVADTIAAGVTAGEFRVREPRLAALALLDMLNGSSSWYSPIGELPATDLADRYAELAIDGLLQAGS